ncbi:hypothetical protein AHF37_04866 [Paragonimus kellicotti]|nr:hypothetical protein AHF37_04866 [Paragonimus kellicotti]
MTPTIFDEHLVTSKPAIFERFLHKGQFNWTSVDFHKTGSQKRLLEEHVWISVTLQRGIPTGPIELWTYYISDTTGITSCFLSEMKTLNPSTMPEKLKKHYAYRVSKGIDFVNATFLCSVRPEHAALIIMSFSTRKDNKSRVAEELKNQLKAHISYWIRNPNSQQVQQTEPDESSRVSYRVQKLKIGWYGSVKQGVKWKMLLAHKFFTMFGGELRYAQFTCYRSTIGDIKSRAIYWTESNREMEYFHSSKPANIKDSGDYDCVAGNEQWNPPQIVLTTRRRFIVIPKNTDLKIVLNHELLDERVPVRGNYSLHPTLPKQPIVNVGEDAFIYCLHNRIPGAKYPGMPLFRVTMQSDTGEATVDMLPKLVRQVSTTNSSTAVYKLDGPEHEKIYGRFTVECSVRHDEQLLSEEDLREPKQLPTISTEFVFYFETRLKPVIFNEELRATDHEMQTQLKYSAVDIASAKLYHQSTPKEALNEAVIGISGVAALGQPRGWMVVYLYFKHDKQLRQQKCSLVNLENITASTLSSGLKARYQQEYLDRVNLVNVSFDCVIQTEQMALAILAIHTNDSGSDASSIEEQLGNSLKQLIQQWEDQPTERKRTLLRYPKNTNVTYRVLRLNMTWATVVNMGMSVKMLGYVDKRSPDAAIKCYYQLHEDKPEIPVGKQFHIKRIPGKDAFYLIKQNVTYPDSGLYRCQVGSESSTMGFIPRRLEVLPDASIWRILITHRPFSDDVQWIGNYEECTEHGQPMINSDDVAYFHCLQTVSTGTLGNYVHDIVLVHNNNTFETRWTKANGSAIRTQDGGDLKLTSYQLQAPTANIFAGSIRFVCRLNYTIPIPNLATNTVSQTIQRNISVSRTAIIRTLVRPYIFTSHCTCSVPALEKRIQSQIKQPSTAVEFHRVNMSEFQLEQIATLTAVVMLGVPRGSVMAQTFYNHGGRLYHENCPLVMARDHTNLTTIASELQSHDTIIWSGGRNFAERTFKCIIRPEHVALSLSVFNHFGETQSEEILKQRVTSSIQVQLQNWVANPNSTEERKLNLPDHWFVDSRMVKLNVKWTATVNIGSVVRLLGYLGRDERSEIKCFFQPNITRMAVAVSNEKVVVGRLVPSWAFYFTIPKIAYTDSGIYSCNVTATCPGCPITIGFVPRRLHVLPDPSMLQLTVNPRLVEGTKLPPDNYTRCSEEDEPCLICGKSMYVYYSYPLLFTEDRRPVAEFSVVMLNLNNGSNTSLTFDEIKSSQVVTEYSILVIRRYKITAPMLNELTGPLNVICMLKFPKSMAPRNDVLSELPALRFERTKRVLVQARFKPFLFKKHTTTSISTVQRVLTIQALNSITNALRFHSSGPAGRISEGCLRITYITLLGSPIGKTKIYGFYMIRGTARRDQCLVEKMMKLTEESTPSDIRATWQYKQALGYYVYNVTLVCPLLPRHIALMLVTYNTYDYQQTPNTVDRAIQQSTEKHIELWMNDTKSTEFNEITGPTDSHFVFQLVRIRVGWRATVPEGHPIIMFGAPNKHVLEHLKCYHSVKKSARKTETNSRSFQLIKRNLSSVFELVKPRAMLEDTGFYTCLLDDSIVLDRQLVVLSTTQRVSLHVSRGALNETRPPTDDWAQMFNDVPYIYMGQKLVFHCTHVVVSRPHLHPKFMAFSELDSIQSKKAVPFNATGMVNITHGETVWSGETYTLLSPIIKTSLAELRIVCAFYYPGNINTNDLNTEAIFRPYKRAKHFEVRLKRLPSILNKSIETSHSETGELLRLHDSLNPTKSVFEWNTNQNIIEEGLFSVNYSVELGQPVGWTKVYTIYNHSSQFIFDQCTLTSEPVSDNGEYNPEPVPQPAAFQCILQPYHIGLLTYAIHSIDLIHTQKEIDADCVAEISNTIQTWYSTQGRSSNSSIRLPVNADGVVRLVRIHVGWTASVNQGSKVQMMGRLPDMHPSEPVCYFGHRVASNALGHDSSFKLAVFSENNTFILYNPSVTLADSGFYKCDFLDCTDCPEYVGMAQRQLLVTPNSSVVHFNIKPEAAVAGVDKLCQLSDIPVVEPGEFMELNCTYPLAHGSTRRISTEIVYGKAQASTSDNQIYYYVTNVTEKMYNGSDFMWSENVGKARLPNSNNMWTNWQVVCKLHLAPIHIPYDLISKVKASSVIVVKGFQFGTRRCPSIHSSTLKTGRSKLTTALQSSIAINPGRSDYQTTISDTPAEEGPFDITFDADLGFPTGWPLVWLLYRDGSQMELNNCTLSINTEKQEELNRIESVRAACLLRPEHVGLLIATVNIPGTNITRAEAEHVLFTALKLNFTRWSSDGDDRVGDDRVGDDQTLKTKTCFLYDLRVIPLHIGWKAFVKHGSPIIMYGLLDGQSGTEIECWQVTHVKESRLSGEFMLNLRKELGYFTVRKLQAAYKDAGYYVCKSSNASVNLSTAGMGKRRLQILPDSSIVKCSISLDTTGELTLNRSGQITADGIPYLNSNQKAYVHCSYDKEAEQMHRASHLLHYWMHDDTTGERLNLTTGIADASSSVDVGGDKNFLTRKHVITGIESKHYKGQLTVSCIALFENMFAALDLHSPTRNVRIDCNQTFTIQEPANGELTVQTMFGSYETQPVPQGSEFTCTGGYGMPPLRYEWIRVRAIMYGSKLDNEDDYTSLLPGERGGWGGPETPFTDAPATTDLTILGATLRVPEDEAYRGMSYRYRCIGVNTIAGKQYQINKTIHFTVMVCSAKCKKFDLTLLASSRILSYCRISANPDGQIQFYGYFYQSLLRQIVLGMPYGLANTRISLLMDDVFDGSTTGYTDSIGFNHNLSRIELVRKLYSRSSKPITVPAGCSAPRMSLEHIVRALHTLRSKSADRKKMAFLTFDIRVNRNLTDRSKSMLSEMSVGGQRIMLGIAHPLADDAGAFQDDMTEVLRATNVTNLLPQTARYTSCVDCQPQLDDASIRIQRGKVFDMICQASDAQPKIITIRPKLELSLPSDHWYSGLDLGVSCTANLVDSWDDEVTTVSLTVCQTTQTSLKELNSTRPTIQRLINACVRQLTTQEVYGGFEYTYFTASTTFHLNDSESEPVLLCFQRNGEESPQLLDAVSYVTRTLKIVEPAIRNLQLIVSQWTAKETASAQFTCQFEGFVGGSESVLLFEDGSKSSDQSLRIVHRARVTLQAARSLVQTRLNWFEVSPRMKSARLYCLVRPVRPENKDQRTLSALPMQTASVQVSPPITGLALFSDCPVQPQIRLTPDTQTVLGRQGSRVDVQCEVPATSKMLPLKFYYLAKDFSIIVCNMETEVQQSVTERYMEQEVTCVPVASKDKDCSKSANKVRFADKAHYPLWCWSKRQTETSDVVRRIQFSIVRLRPQDFNGKVFCETVNLYADANHASHQRTLLSSPVHSLRFVMPPQVTRFVYEPQAQMWVCTAVAHPLTQEGDIFMLRTKSIWLGRQLKLYKTRPNVTQPTLLNSELLPQNMDTGHNYTIQLQFESILPIPGGLRAGTVWMRCKFGNTHRDLMTQITTGIPSDEVIIPQPPRSKELEGLYHDCRLNNVPGENLTRIIVHRIAHNHWLHYDSSVAIAPLLKRTAIGWTELLTRGRKVRFFGHWTNSLKPTSLVVTGTESGESVTSITLNSSSAFDSDRYYCSGHYTNGTILTSTFYSQLVMSHTKQLAVGYRQINPASVVWRREARTVVIGRPIHFRCSIWTTNVADRAVHRFSVVAQYNRSATNGNVSKTVHSTGVTLQTIDHYMVVRHVGRVKNFGCVYSHNKTTQEHVIRDLEAACHAPKVSWEPIGKSVYTFTDNVTCKVQSGCDDAQIKWDWLAGPIPQMSFESDKIRSNKLSLNETLFLNQLPRGGNYVFRCIATCTCQSQLSTSSTQASFYVQPRPDTDADSDEEIYPLETEEEEVPDMLSLEERREILEPEDEKIRRLDTKSDGPQGADSRSDDWVIGGEQNDSVKLFDSQVYAEEVRKLPPQIDVLSAEESQLGSFHRGQLDRMKELQSEDTEPYDEGSRQPGYRPQNLLPEGPWLSGPGQLSYGMHQFPFTVPGQPGYSLRHIPTGGSWPADPDKPGYGLQQLPPGGIWPADRGKPVYSPHHFPTGGSWPTDPGQRAYVAQHSTTGGVWPTGVRPPGYRLQHSPSEGLWSTSSGQLDRSLQHGSPRTMGPTHPGQPDDGRYGREGWASVAGKQPHPGRVQGDINGLAEVDKHSTFSIVDARLSALYGQSIPRIDFDKSKHLTHLEIPVGPDTPSDKYAVRRSSDSQSWVQSREDSFRGTQGMDGRDGTGRMRGPAELSSVVTDKLDKRHEHIRSVYIRERVKGGRSPSSEDDQTQQHPISPVALDELRNTIGRDLLGHSYRRGPMIIADQSEAGIFAERLSERLHLPLYLPSQASGSYGKFVQGLSALKSPGELLHLTLSEAPTGDNLVQSRKPSRMSKVQIGHWKDFAQDVDTEVRDRQTDRIRIDGRRRVPPSARTDKAHYEIVSASDTDLKADSDQFPRIESDSTGKLISRQVEAHRKSKAKYLHRDKYALLPEQQPDIYRKPVPRKRLLRSDPVDRFPIGESHGDRDSFQDDPKGVDFERVTLYDGGYRSPPSFVDKLKDQLDQVILGDIKKPDLLTGWRHDSQTGTFHYTHQLFPSYSKKQDSQEGLETGRSRQPSIKPESDFVTRYDRDRRLGSRSWWSVHVGHSAFQQPLMDLTVHELDQIWPTTNAGRLQKAREATRHQTYTSWQQMVALDGLEDRYGIGNKKMTEVMVEPSLVLLPATTTVRCPQLASKLNGGYQPSFMTWVRAPATENVNPTDSEEIITFSLDERHIITISSRFKRPDRVYIYPPSKWKDAYTLDITGLVSGDYGFYKCIITLSSPRLQPSEINLTKVASTPLCIIPPVSVPRMFLERSPYGEVKVENTNTQKIDEGLEGNCLHTDEELIIKCTAMPYRIFCEKGDFITNGYRLFNTGLQAYLYLADSSGSGRKIWLEESSDNWTKYIQLSANDSAGVIKMWILKVRDEYHGAHLHCLQQPELILPSMIRPVYWDWLKKEFTSKHQHLLERRSKPVEICIGGVMRSIHTEPEPTVNPKNQLGFLSVQPGQLITCNSMQKNNSLLSITIYPILQNRRKYLSENSDADLLTWVDHERLPIHWPNHTGYGKMRVFIPNREEVTGHYLFTCTEESRNESTRFILRISPNTFIIRADLIVWTLGALVTAGTIRLFVVTLKHTVNTIRARRPQSDSS